MNIVVHDLCGVQIIKLLEEHLANMHSTSPPGSVHALDLDSLKSSDLTFWSVWEDDAVVGCGALKSPGKQHG